MARTRHHGKHGKPENPTKRQAPGYEYWGRDAYPGADREKIVKTRRLRAKRELREDE